MVNSVLTKRKLEANTLDPDEMAHNKPTHWIYTVCKAYILVCIVERVNLGDSTLKIKLQISLYGYAASCVLTFHLIGSVTLLMSSHTYGEGDILFLVKIQLALVSVLTLALASHFLLCTVSCKPVVGFLPNFMDVLLGHNKELIDIGDYDLIFKVTAVKN